MAKYDPQETSKASETNNTSSSTMKEQPKKPNWLILGISFLFICGIYSYITGEQIIDENALTEKAEDHKTNPKANTSQKDISPKKAASETDAQVNKEEDLEKPKLTNEERDKAYDKVLAEMKADADKEFEELQKKEKEEFLTQSKKLYEELTRRKTKYIVKINDKRPTTGGGWDEIYITVNEDFTKMSREKILHHTKGILGLWQKYRGLTDSAGRKRFPRVLIIDAQGKQFAGSTLGINEPPTVWTKK